MGGNYKDYHVTHNYSWTQLHVDAHFGFVDASVFQSLTGWIPGVSNPPASIQAKCNCEPTVGIPDTHVSLSDCIPGMGRHWPEDKLEPPGVFALQPAQIFGSYDCLPAFWEPMVSATVFDWVRDNAPGQTATMSWNQPRLYHERGFYPKTYTVRETSQIVRGNPPGRNVEIAFSNFVFRTRNGEIDMDNKKRT